MNKLRLGIIGNGYLGEIIAGAWRDGLLPEYELVGIVGRTKEKTDALTKEMGCSSCAGIDDLLELKPDYIAEAASGDSVRDMAEKILANGCNLIVLSIGAFADKEFYEKVKATAVKHNTKVYIASGAVGGFDVLRTVSLMGEATAGIETRKGPGSLMYTPLFEEHLMTDEESTMVFDGNAIEAIGLLPTKVNVAVASSLATVGPDKTRVNIHSVPGMIGDDHKITAEIEGVKAVVDIYSSTSAIAGWSVVAVLQNIVSPIVF
ncbi:MAG: DUF108 domain-containing protein [Lachnospiraceae bacterium]|jgi:aspartate dehydrogenase|nr:DUF108 domain-containing protein [Lachnospiraceae bacterium]